MAVIRQTLTLSTSIEPVEFGSSTNVSNNWGVGGVMGLEGSWKWNCGLRIQGNASASLLYTEYTTLNDRQKITFNLPPVIPPTSSVVDTGYQYNDYNSGEQMYTGVRPMMDLALGLGWGRYVHGNNYHFDLFAGYEFKMLWSQNMLRAISNNYSNGSAFSPGDLWVHGLTITARWDF